MSDTPKTAKISGRVIAGSEQLEISPESLRFEMDVNSFPMVSATGHVSIGNDITKAPVSDEVIKRIGQLQLERLAGRTETDFRVDAEDGLGGKIFYSGFISSPSLELSDSRTTDRYTSVGEAALLDSLDMSIYRAGETATREEMSVGGPDALKPIPSAKDGDVPALIRDITSVLVENFDNSLKLERMEVAKELMQLQHDVNLNGPVDIWNSILRNSTVKYESWEALLKKSPTAARKMTEYIRVVMASQTPGFWNKIRSFLAEFQMHYVPAFDGLGRFERADKKVGEPEATMSVSVSGLVVSDGSPRLLQPGGVVMKGLVSTKTRPEGNGNPEQIIAFAPDPLLAGFIQRESMPLWIQRKEGHPILGTDVDKSGSASDGKVNLRLDARKARIKEGEAYRESVDGLTQEILTELCEVMYANLQLEHSSVGLTTPLDFSLNQYMGKRVTVEAKSKESGATAKFTAFVSGITHTAELSEGKSLNSNTQVRLSHAKFS